MSLHARLFLIASQPGRSIDVSGACVRACVRSPPPPLVSFFSSARSRDCHVRESASLFTAAIRVIRGWTGSREALEDQPHPPAASFHLDERRTDGRTERSLVLASDKLARAERRRRVAACARARGALEESQPLSYHTLGLRQAASALTSPLFSVAASRLLTFLRKSTARQARLVFAKRPFSFRVSAQLEKEREGEKRP